MINVYQEPLVQELDEYAGITLSRRQLLALAIASTVALAGCGSDKEQPVAGPVDVIGDPENLSIQSSANLSGLPLLGSDLRDKDAYVREAYDVQKSMNDAATGLATSITKHWLELRLKTKDDAIAVNPLPTVVGVEKVEDTQAVEIRIRQEDKPELVVTYGLTPDRKRANLNNLLVVSAQMGEVHLDLARKIRDRTGNPTWFLTSDQRGDTTWPKPPLAVARTDAEWQQLKADIASGLDFLEQAAA